MEVFSNLAMGFGVALSLNNIMYCFIGVMLGTLIGVLPGIGPIATISMLLPATFVLPPVSALIMLAGIMLVVVASMGSHEFRLKPVLILAV